MRYAKLSCIKSHSCYLQQFLSIDLFFYRTSDHGQKVHMNKVCPSFCLEVFLELAFLVFYESQHVIRGPCRVVHDSARCFENNVLPQKWGK